jgi:molybdopterin-guanine dinucleotide biosynthesis adapter protein
MTNRIISIVGRSDTGKTTLIEKLVPALRNRGFRVGTIKHDVHGFDIDHKGKDSWRHKNAGAAMTVISSPRKVGIVKDVDHDAEIDELVTRYMDDVDIILTEGYKRSNKPKIEVYRKAAYDDLLCTGEDNLLAIATDSTHDLDVPQFDINDAEGLAGLIEEKFLMERKLEYISLEVNGKPIPMKPFLHDMLINSISGMIRALHGCSEPEKIILKIETASAVHANHKLVVAK